jgi:hypothetical protein
VLRAGGPGDPRERALQAVVGLGATLDDPLRLDLLCERAERVLGLAPAVLKRAVAMRRGGRRDDDPVARSVRRARSHEQGVERQLLRALLAAPVALEAARRELSPEDFRDTDCAALARALWSGAPPGGGEEDGAAVLARELAAAADAGTDWESEARGAVRSMRVRRLRDRQREVEVMLRRAEGDEAVRLLQMIQDIARSLKELSEP